MLFSVFQTHTFAIMFIQYASDLHLEYSSQEEYMKLNPLEAKGEILLLAGDIIYLTETHFGKSIFDTWSKQFQQVFIVPGNHEFYGKHFPIKQTFPSFKKEIRENVHYLNNKVKILGNVRLIFTTLFSDISPESSILIKRYLNDFHISRYDDESHLSLTIKEYNKCHMLCRLFLQEELEKPFSGKTVVVSHHVPYLKNQIAGYPRLSYDLSAAFHVDLTWMIKKYSIDHWISGHTHINYPSIQIGQTQFHTNQLGYVEKSENEMFNVAATIDL